MTNMVSNYLLPEPNRDLYQRGKAFKRRLKRDTQGAYTKETLKDTADRCRTSVAEVSTAVEFTDSVDRIAAAAGSPARDLILSGENLLLTPALVRKLAKKKRGLQMALRTAAAGLHPRARALTNGLTAETVIWDYHLDRLQKAAALLDPRPRKVPPLSLEDRQAVYKTVTAIRAVAPAILLALRSWGHPGRSQGTSSTAAVLPKEAKKARRLVEAVAHDLPLVLCQQNNHPTAMIRMLRSATDKVLASATHLSGITAPTRECRLTGMEAQVVDCPNGPTKALGTYVLTLRSKQPFVLRIGKLETFWIPAGYLLYIGRAFGGGGVKDRTGRHQRSNALRRWNLDHIKTIAAPVELWWTEHLVEVECSWAMALAELPRYCCPAPCCGARDCKSCPAHLYHVSRRPSCEDFADVVRQMIPGHATIYRQRLA